MKRDTSMVFVAAAMIAPPTLMQAIPLTAVEIVESSLALTAVSWTWLVAAMTVLLCSMPTEMMSNMTKTLAQQYPCNFNQRNRNRCACQNCYLFRNAEGRQRKARLRAQWAKRKAAKEQQP